MVLSIINFKILYKFFSASSHVPPLVPNPVLKYWGRKRGGSKGTTNWYLGVSSAMHARAKMQSFLRGP